MFITFEGGDGSGKTTAIKQVKQLLEKNGYDIVFTHEPGGTTIGEAIRQIILDKKNTNLDKYAEALLYAASRQQHIAEKIIPNLKKNKIIICDRYIDSSLAYQGIARKIGLKKIIDINSINIWPNITFLFDINPKISLMRLNKKKNKREINRLDLESLNFHMRVRKAFLKLAKKYSSRYIIIDATMKTDEIVKKIYQTILKMLKKNVRN